MKEQKKAYLTPKTDLLTLPSDPIMLSPGDDSNAGAWQLLMDGLTNNT